MDLLATLLWAGAVGGVIAVVVGLAQPSRRRAALILAAVLFLPIGILGIMSIGIFFLAAALLCIIGAVLSRPPADRVPAPSP